MEQKILVVDDEQRMRKLVKDFLVRENFTVLEAADGEELQGIPDSNLLHYNQIAEGILRSVKTSLPDLS